MKDDTGGVLPGVELTVTHLDTNTVRTSVTDDLGQYRVSQLPLGDFEVEAALAGFQTSIRRGLQLTLGQEAVVNITMNVGEITEEVIVTGAAPLVETTTSQLSGLIDEREIRDLPLNGRSFTELAVLQPGVVTARAAGQSLIVGMGQKISVNGSRVNATSFILDGTDINDSMGQSPGSVNGVVLGVETVREFQTLLQTYSAEYGRAAGGVVSAVTKSGTNELHGSVFEFHRNSALDAKNFFDRLDEDIPPFKRNQFGFVLGGPIVKDKTFFLGSYEGMRNREGETTGIVDVPNALAHQGIIPIDGVLTDVGVDPAVQPYLDLYPLPTGADLGNGEGEWNQVFNRREDEDYFLARIDHNFSDSDSFFVRYTFQEGTSIGPSNLLDLVDFDDTTRNQYVTLEWKHVFSPSLLNVARVGFNRSLLNSIDQVIDARTADPALAFEPGKPNMGNIGISGLATIGRSSNRPRFRVLNVFEYADTVSYTKGRHSVKFGVNYKRYQQNHNQRNTHFGSYLFSGLEEFLVNDPRRYNGALVGFDDYRRGDRHHIPSLFIQDDFQVTPNLTLNLGLRWETATENREVNGKTAAVNVVTDSRSFQKSPSYETPHDTFAPRLGFAWDPGGAGRTAIRGGAGMFHQMILEEVYLAARQLFPFVDIFATGRDSTFPNPLLASPTGAAIRIDSVDQFLDVPYYMQYNLIVQRELFPNWSLTVGYVGSRGVNLTRYVNPNSAIPDILPDGTFFWPNGRDANGVGCEDTSLPSCTRTERRNPAFSRIRMATSGSDSWYNALQVKLEKRFSQNFQFQISYNYSKSMDTASAMAGSDFSNLQTLPQNYYDIKAQRSVSAFHLNHTFGVNYSWELPFLQGAGGAAEAIFGGWTLRGILSLTSGTPVTIHISDNLDNERDRTSGSESRSSLVAGRDNNPVTGDPAQWFDPSAFELAPEGFLGNLGRLTGRADDFANFDFAVGKNTQISEEVTLQFRAEFFNIFNHPNFRHPTGRDTQAFQGSPGRPRGNSSFGRVTGTDNDSREIQFALKLLF